MSVNFSHKQNNLSISERFSMYIDIQYSSNNSHPRFISQSNPLLANFISFLREKQPQKREDYWARLFLQGLLDNNNLFKVDTIQTNLHLFAIYLNLCQQLLICYLQLICFYSAKKVSQRFSYYHNLNVFYTLEDCFLIATEASLQPEKLLKSFNFDLKFPVYGYARNALIRYVNNKIAKEVKSKSIKFSDSAILVYVGQKELEASLKNYGIAQEKLIIYRLVWQGYKDILGQEKQKQKKIKLTDVQTERIMNYCQQQIARLKLGDFNLNQQKITKILLVCLQAIKQNEMPLIVSTDEKKGDSEKSIIDDLSDNLNQEQDLVTTEENQAILTLKNLIAQEINQLESSGKISLLLWLGLGLNQKDFLVILGLSKQYQVARKFQGYQKNILKKVINFYINQDQKDQQLDKQKVNQSCAAQMSYVKEYLESYSKNFFSQLLQDLVISETTIAQKEILLNSMADQDSIKNKIQQLFYTSIEDQLGVSLQQFSSIHPAIATFIDRWLEQNQALLY